MHDSEWNVCMLRTVILLRLCSRYSTYSLNLRRQLVCYIEQCITLIGRVPTTFIQLIEYT